jgi:His/Glu/Gln/Arg/opine family amino acid ABC transporter permease subunit
MTSAVVLQMARYLALGAASTVVLSLAAMAVAGTLGLAFALVRLYAAWPLKALTNAVIFLVKGVPLLILLISANVILPYLRIDWPASVVASLTIGVYFAAYASDIYRAAITSIPATQWDAGRSLGCTPWGVFSVVIFPQTLRFCAAPLIGLFIMMVKSTSLVSAIGAWELLAAGRETAERTFLVLPLYLSVAGIYFVACFGLSRLARRVERAVSHA